ncbi:tRNA (guanine(10)-N2)-methyltransferase homolog [Agrilus planipennis]|uniref:tRNA (guanine(10)-N(2))-methyltransferase TRMT11 n=1 Tax=Agrilus planipennis TaxID=224129 RepID=A0A1W4WZE2_AGRPL|nr:tRNA (guanine(10)-N2)-methyltransferase homolog [Agrilus planipennis]
MGTMNNFIKMNKKYLLWFAQEHIEFRREEIMSLVSLFNIKMNFVEEPTLEQPFWVVEFLNEDDVHLLANRSVSLRSCIELLTFAKSVKGLHENLKTFSTDYVKLLFDDNKSFKIEVETFGKHFTHSEKVNKLQAFDYLPYKGKVKLKDPDTLFYYIEYYGTDPTCPPKEPYDVYFGRWIINGLRQLVKKFSLKTRKFIGNTTMDPQLSFLMANQAKVKKGDLILDPFVGTGSLLISAAYFGGYILGTDIDYLMLHGKTRPSRISQKVREKDESIKANMVQYNLESQYLDVMVSDFAAWYWKDSLKFDAILTDPPYGIREATEKIGIHKEAYTISEEHLATHIPAKIEYGISQMYFDLLKFSCKHLKIGGRLVCWFPVFREDYTVESLPSSNCLKLVANSEQILSKYTSRRLLTYEKIKEPGEVDLDNEITIADFREKYFMLREETRKEKRIKKAQEKYENYQQYLQKKENK